jgi:hypothetical protein
MFKWVCILSSILVRTTSTVSSLNTFDEVFVSHDRVLLCETLSSTYTGITSMKQATHCVCDAGFEGEMIIDEQMPIHCAACIQGKFQSNVGFGNVNETMQWNFCVACASTKTSLAGARTADECVCIAGYEESWDSVLASETCVPCQNGFFKSHVGNDHCLECFPHSTTLVVGTTNVNACLCLPGYSVSESPESFSSMCVECDIFSFKNTTDMTSCTPCHSNSQTNGAAVSEDECLCQAGFFLQNGACVQCVKGFYKTEVSNNACVPCPGFNSGVETTQGTGSVSIDACVCAIGAGFLPESDEFTNTCTHCPANSHQNTEADTNCVFCDATQFAEQNGDFVTCQNCQANSVRMESNGNISDCHCNAGFSFNSATILCEACIPGTYKTEIGNSHCTLCPIGKFQDAYGQVMCDVCHDNAFSLEGSTNIDQCICNAGYHPIADACELCLNGYVKATVGNFACTACEAGKYSTNSLNCVSCPPDSTTVSIASTDISNCLCMPGYEQDNVTLYTCKTCSPNFYCLGQNQTIACHANSTSVAGSTSSSACICNPGFYLSSLANCANCPPNSFCFDNLQYTCPSNSESAANSADESACVCNAGYENIDAS